MHEISPQWQKSKGCKGKKAKLALEKAIARWNTNSIPTGSDFVSDNNAAVDSTEVNKKHNLIQQSTDIIKCNENQNIVHLQYLLNQEQEKKFQYFSTPNTSVNNGFNYAIVHNSMWKTLLQTLSCENFGKNEFSLNSTLELCYTAKLRLFCSSCQKVYGNTFSSRSISQSKQFEINVNIVEAFLHMGKGHSAVEKFSMALGIQTMDRRAFVENTQKELILNAARKTIREQHELLDMSLQGKEIIDIGVSFDGTWHKRGEFFTILHWLHY